MARPPTIRHREVLVADSTRIPAWRNLGQTEAVACWIAATGAGAPASSASRR